ncbi:MAG TPA: hypothetical protein VLG49_02000 [Rhabdochlamydiaceae bacterium]|nr:hypothetical protein [Rhabdochlamydiaceae bacterium]
MSIHLSPLCLSESCLNDGISIKDIGQKIQAGNGWRCLGSL